MKIKTRLLHLWSTIPALCVLGLLAVWVNRKPDLLDKPEGLIVLAGGLLGLVYKGRGSGEANG
jgi:hypothetical protein